MRTILVEICHCQLLTDIFITLGIVALAIIAIAITAWKEATKKRKEIEDDVYDDSM